MKSLNSFFIFRSSRPNLQSSYISLDRWLTVGSPSGLNAKWKQNPFMRFAAVLTLIFSLGVGNAWADYASNFTDKNLSVGTGELTWSASPAFSSYESSGSARGAQSAKASTNITITSANITGTITGIEVVGSMNGAGSMSVTVGGSSFGSKAAIAKGDSKKTYSFTGNATITDKAVVITVTRSANATFWIKSVTIQVGTTKTYHEWDGSEYQTSAEFGTTISKAPTALCSVGAPESYGWVTEEYAGTSAPSPRYLKDADWPDGKTDLYAVYYYDAGDDNAYYSTHPTIYYVTYSTTHATLDENYSHTCTTDILDLASPTYGSYVYAYYTPESGYSLDKTCFTFTYTSGGGKFTPSDMSYNSADGELWIDGVDGDITITAVAKTCTKLANATDLSVNTNYQSDGNTYVRFSWTPGTGTTTNATNQEICFGLVGNAGKCVSSLSKEATYTGDLKSKLADGEYWWSIKALGDGTTYCDGDAVEGPHFTICNTDITSSTPDIVPGTPDKTSCEVLFDLTGANSYSVTLKNNSTNAVVGSYNNVSNTTGDITFTGLTPSTTYRVEVVAHNACGDNSITGSETFTTDAATLYTVTFVNQSGAAVSPVTQTAEGGNVTLPSASPSAACAALGWTFAGWKDGAAQEETTATPTLIAAGSYTPSENKTFYAVFTKTEGGGGSVGFLNYTEVTSAPSDWSGNYLLYDGTHLATGSYASNALTWETADAPGSTEMSAKEFTLTKITYNSTTYYTLQNASGTYIGVTSATSSKTNLVSANSASTTYYYWTPSTSYILNLGATRYLGNNTTSAFKAYVTSNTSTNTPAKLYKRNEGSVGTTYWNSNPSCSSDATVTYHNNGAKSGSAPTDANSPYTIGDNVTVLGMGTMVAPDGKEFKCWNTAADGTGTDYNIGAKFDIAGNMDFYPKWVNAPYTVTFDAEGGTCGTSSLTEASGGAGVTLPAATATCAPAGWSFYGWATSTCSSTTSAPSIVGAAGSTYYPTSNITLHAVYKEGGYAIGTGSFAQVTGEANVVDGTFYLITNVNNAGGMMYNTVTASPRIGSTTNSYASCNDINCAWQMKKNGDYWQIYSPNKNLYAAGTGVASRATLMSDGTDDKTKWTLETTGEGNYKFKNKYNTAQGVNAYLAYSDGNGYCCMANNGSREVLYLYKAASGAVVAGTTTYNSNPTCVTYNITLNQTTGGTIYVNGTTDSPQESLADQKITLSATPESGYRFTGWTITKTTGGNDVTSTLLGANATTASTSFTMPDYDVTVSATFTEKVMYSITWNVNGSTYATGDPSTSAESGTKWSALTLPTAPADNTLSDCDRTKFVGWSTSQLFGDGNDAPADLFKSTSDDNADSHTITEATTFYAVFAKGGGEGSWVVDGSNITATGSGDGYTKYNGDHELSDIGYKTNQVMPSSENLQFQASAGYLYNTTAMPSDITSIVLAVNTLNVYEGTAAITSTGGLTPLSPTGSGPYTYTFTSGNRYFLIKEPDSGASYSTVTVNYEGTGTDYATQCCTLKPVTNLAVSSTTANSVTLTWTAPSPTTGIDHLELRNASTDVKIGSNIAVGTTTTSVSELVECNTYSYKIVSVGDVCETPSNIVEATPFGGSKTVTFNYNRGTGTPASFTTSCGNLSTTLPTPDARDGYTFLGWWTAADGGSKVGDAEAEYPVSTTTTIHAHWAQNFTVTYDRVGGTDVCANETCGAGMTYTVCGTEPTKSGYIFAGWKDASTSVVYNAGDNFTMPAADVTLTAQWTANWRNLTFNVPAGGGSITGGPSGNHVLDNRTFTFPNITGKSDAKWCWTFLGWTETAPNGSGTWATTPSYIAGGATSGAITSDKTYYAVYSKIGAGASGDVECDAEAIKAIGTGGGHVYADEEWTIAAADQSSWKARAYVGNKGTYLQIAEGAEIYIKLPTVGGNYTSITLNHNSNSSSRTIVYRTDKNGDIVASHTTGAYETSSTIDISGGSTTGYIMMTGSYTYQITSITAHFGPPAVYGYTLDDCGCQVTQFNLTYNANSTTFPGSTISCSDEVDYVFASHDDEYTFCSAPTPPTGYRFLYWAENANGTGNHWEAGETVSCLPSADLTVYAFYERVYTVSFNNQGTITPVTQASAGASVDVPSATSPCSGEWAFVGWSETAIAPMSFLPTLEITAGEGTYTPTADKTLYAIYRKTSESSPFVAGMSGAYKISNGGTVYAGAASTKLAETDAEGAVTYYITYTAADGGKYTIQRNDGKYIAYSGSSTDLSVSDAAYYWTITKNGDLWRVLGVGSGRYLQYSSGTGFKAYNYNTTSNTLAFVAAEGEYYYRTMSCEDEFDITFHNNGTTINWAGGYPEAAYKGLADATVISTFPTATFDGWTFIGWRQADYKESTDAPASSSVFGGSNGTSGNKLTIASANVDLYPVFTRFEENEPFDQINGGDYYIYFLESGSDDGYGAEKRVYAATYDGSLRYNSSAVCDNATTFTFTKLGNGNWTIYDNTTKKYLYGVAGNNDLKQKDGSSGAEWTLTLNGNQFDAFHVGTEYGQITAFGDGESASFMNYARTNIGTNPSYHRVYLGGCTNRTFTTNPSTTPNIEIHGQVKVTSTAGKSIKSTSVLTVSASNIATANLTVTSNNNTFKFSLTSNGEYTASVNIPVVSNKVGVTPIYVEYTPTITTDGIEEATITVSDGDVTPTEVSTESGDVQGRHVPANFVIAAKWGDKWYALPANCTESTSSTTGVLIEVDNASDPTRALAAPSYTKWGLQTVRPTRKAEYGTRLVFTEQLTTATADDQKTLYNGSTTNIQANAQYGNYATTNPDNYEWLPTTTDLKDYILTSATTLGGDASARTVSLSNKGVFGTLLTNKAYDGKVRLLPATFVEPAEMQVVEWKTSSVVVMYTGAGTKATTQLGDDTPISAQSLTAAKKDHGVFELTTGTLTSAKNEPLNITIQNGSDAIVGRKSFVVPAIVSGSQDAPLGLTSDEATLTDVVVLDGATLSAVATKYTFKNITVYPGGKLVIGSGKQLGMASLTLRGGSAWGAATYEHKYPQFVVNNAMDGAYSNTSGVINYDYVTTKDQYYSFVLPYDGSTSAIKYPLDIYGSAVSASNTGSFEFQYYDGAARAAGGTGWKVLAEPATLVAGTGYTFLGMPKKVDAYDGTDDTHAITRQRYGIHRIPMNVAAATVQAGETNNKTAPLSVTLADKNNNSGWNLVGNPFMVTLSGLSSDDIQVGKLVHTDTNPWDGKWRWDPETMTENQRFVVIPGNDGQTYESELSSSATLPAFKNFFVQIGNESADAISFSSTNRVLAPARYMDETEQDIRLAVDLVSEARKDKVDLLINDIYSAAFDINGDFTKMMNGTNFNLYGVYPEDYLSFIAVDKTTAAGSIAIGYQVPAGGEYTLQLSDREYVMTDAIEALYVTDHEVSPEVTTDLLDGPYTFHVNNAETNNTRFTVSIRLAPMTPTDIGNVPDDGMSIDNAKPRKFIWQDKMYILRNGVIYDATGKKVK